MLAVEKLLNENVNVKLTLVGDGELKEQLESRFKRQDGRIIFHGWSDNIVNILKVNDSFYITFSLGGYAISNFRSIELWTSMYSH